MVEIINRNVRRSSICWRGRRELITDVRKPEIMVMTSLWWAESYLLITPITPRKLVTLNPNSNQQAPDATSFFPLVGCLLQAAWPERLLSESQDAVALQQIKSVALYL